MMSPPISVIVPVYNAEQWLKRCIDSILAQTYTDFELLLIDDGSTDRSDTICDEYANLDSRIRVFHKPNAGVSSARNLGLNKAVGEWICFIDADDWVESDMLALLLNKANESKADIVFSDFFYEFPEKCLAGHFYDWNKTGLEGINEYIAHGMNYLWGCIYKKKIYNIHIIKSPENITCCEDFHVIIRLLYFADKVAKVSKSLYHYRQHEMSALHNSNKKSETDEQWVYADIIRFFKEHDSYDRFKKVMAWRTLKASQDLALDIDSFDKFCAYNPDKKDHILDCPYIGKKIKLITWLLSHGYRNIAGAMINVRNYVKK